MKDFIKRAKRAITVYPPELDLVDLKSYKPASVNWAALGSVKPCEAKIFAKLLLKAAKKAEKLNENLK